MRVIIWLALPVATLAFLCRGYIVSIVARGGNQTIASLFAVLCLVIFLRSLYHIAARSFYAQSDTKTPLVISLISLSVSLGFLAWFFFGLHVGATAIVWANAIWATLEIAILLMLMAKRLPNLFNREFFTGVTRMVIATFSMAIVTYFLVKVFGLEFVDQNLLMVVLPLGAIGLISLTIYVIISRIFKLEEVTPLIDYLKKILFGRFHG